MVSGDSREEGCGSQDLSSAMRLRAAGSNGLGWVGCQSVPIARAAAHPPSAMHHPPHTITRALSWTDAMRGGGGGGSGDGDDGCQW